MLDTFPSSVNEGIGRYIFHGLELLAAMSLTCIITSILCAVLAYRSTGRSRIVWIWVGVSCGFLALVPPGFVIYAVNH
jgi:hypothetical protein